MSKKASRRSRRAEPSTKPLTAEKLRLRTAFHEAGHAVLACLLRQPFHCASIDPDGPFRGRVTLDMSNIGPRDLVTEQPDGRFRASRPRVSPERTLEKYTLIAAAGPVAETMLQGKHVVTEGAWEHDLAFAIDLALDVFGDHATAEEYVDLVSARVPLIVVQKPVFRAVSKVGDALLKREQLSSRDVRAIVRENTKGYTAYKKLLKHVPFNSMRDS
jgi:hypothetical protein